jgi:hypothetical protein
LLYLTAASAGIEKAIIATRAISGLLAEGEGFGS